MSKTEIYIGSRKVSEYLPSEEANLVAVKYTDGTVGEFTLRQWESVKSPIVYNDQEVQVKKFAPIVQACLKEMLADNIQILEKDFILGQVDNSLVHNYNDMIAMMFGVSDPKQVTMGQIDAAMTAAAKKEEDKNKEADTEDKE